MSLIRWFAATIIAALLVGPIALAPLTGHGLLVVTGGSMAPTYELGDVLITTTPTGDDLRPGRIVVVGTSSQRYTHRVVSLDRTQTRARLQGDANATPDPLWVSQTDVTAVPVAHLSGVTAAVVRTLMALPGRVVLLCALGTLLLLPRRSLRTPRHRPAAPRSYGCVAGDVR